MKSLIVLSFIVVVIPISVFAQASADYKIPKTLAVVDFQTQEDRDFMGNFESIKTPALIRRMLKTDEQHIVPWLRQQTADIHDYQMTIQMMRQGVLATDKQFAWVKREADICAEILHLSPTPPIFIVGDAPAHADVVNFKEPFIVLSSEIVEKSDPPALRFILGQQMGHIKCDHVFYRTLFSGELNTVGVILGKWVQELIKAFISKVTDLIRVDWVLASSISADRAGLIACQDLLTAQQALLNYRLVIPIEKVEINVEDYLNQQKIIQEKESVLLNRLPESAQKALGQWRRSGRLTSSQPFMFQRLKALEVYAASEEYRKMFE